MNYVMDGENRGYRLSFSMFHAQYWYADRIGSKERRDGGREGYIYHRRRNAKEEEEVGLSVQKFAYEK